MKKQFDITGMTCAACAAHVEKAVVKTGAQNVNVNLLANRLTCETELSDAEIIKAVEGAGYGAAAVGAKQASAPDKKPDEARPLLVRFLVSIIFLLPLMYFSMGHMAGFPLGALDPHVDPASFALIQLVLATPVLIINRRFFIGGAKALMHRSSSMDTLVSLGSGASYIYGIVIIFMINAKVAAGDMESAHALATNLFFESAAMILALVTLGKFLEAKSKGKTRSEVEKLLRMRPDTATVIRGGANVTVSVEEIVKGDIVVVLPGEYIPCDGVITSGATTIDKSAITGESIPVEAGAGDEATSAAINLTGRIEIRAERVGEDTTLSKIVELIENAGGSKAPIQRIADRISAVFVPIVCAISLITLTVWLIIGGSGRAFNMAISVLVISCPCALGLATPVAVMAGTGRAAAYGILVKNAETLQRLGGVNIFALDKTATITEGRPRVINVDAPGSLDKDRVLYIAATLEAASSHPLAKAITEAYGAPVTPPENSEYRVGYGIVGEVDGETYALGSHKLMKEFGVSVPKTDALDVCLCRRGELLGMITVDDEIKPTSAAAIAKLSALGARCVMITGDNEKQAQKIASRVGMTEVYCDVLPEDKLSVVKKLKAEGVVAMVGDGINDAPALKEADVGIAIGSGTDVAIEAADVVLVKSDLADVPRSVAVSRATMRNVKQNLFWAFIYNTLGIPLAAGALYALGVTLNPMIAAAAMACSSLFVVTNALRLTVKKFDDAHIKGKAPAPKNAISVHGQISTVDEVDEGEDIMKVTLKVGGMSCMHCAARVESALKAVDGVKSASVKLEKAEAVVKGDFDTEAVIAAVKEAGYNCQKAE